MKKIYSGKDMKKIDNHAICDIGIPSLSLMEMAAYAVKDEVAGCCRNFFCGSEISAFNHKEYFDQVPLNGNSIENFGQDVVSLYRSKRKLNVLVISGCGNNGADGLAAGRLLYLTGNFNLKYMIIGKKDRATDEFKIQKGILDNLGIEEIYSLDNADIIIDALFGVGLSRDISGQFFDIIKSINNYKKSVPDTLVVSVDMPSGVNADDGQIMGTAVCADITVTFGYQKKGLVLYPGALMAGDIRVRDIGFPDYESDKLETIYALEKSDLHLIPSRPQNSHKGTFGKILVVAGNDDITGAAVLSSLAAFKTGCGMVMVFTSKKNADIIRTAVPEAMVTGYDGNSEDHTAILNKLSECLSWCDTVIFGPGIGVGKLQKSFAEQILKSHIPAVIDADAINVISKYNELYGLLHDKVVITPHVLEMSRFSGLSAEYIKSNLPKNAQEISRKFGVTVVLKDARTVVVSDEHTYINMSGNSGMATAGSGDVLTGIIGALIGRGMDISLAAPVGVYVHGLAGDYASSKFTQNSMMASDIIDQIKDVISLSD